MVPVETYNNTLVKIFKFDIVTHVPVKNKYGRLFKLENFLFLTWSLSRISCVPEKGNPLKLKCEIAEKLHLTCMQS